MIIVYTPFKTSSSTLIKSLKLSKIEHKKQHSFGHVSLKSQLDQSPNIIISLIRKPSDLFVSAFFQDISFNTYDYHYSLDRNVVLKESTENLVKHFNKIDWESYTHLSIFNIIDQYEELEKTGIIKLKNKTNFYKKYSSGKTTLYIVDSIHVEKFIKDVLKLAKLVPVNIGKKKMVQTKIYKC